MINRHIWRVFVLFVLLCVGLVVNGQGLTAVEADSSPSNIISTKGSSVLLHWSYSYIGDGLQGVITVTYREQIVEFNSTSQPSVQTLAKRIGQNGALRLESPVPAPFTRRVQVISSNSTLVIHNLQYNDSSWQFSSYIEVNLAFGGTRNTNHITLKPVVSITVNGMNILTNCFGVEIIGVLETLRKLLTMKLEYVGVE